MSAHQNLQNSPTPDTDHFLTDFLVSHNVLPTPANSSPHARSPLRFLPTHIHEEPLVRSREEQLATDHRAAVTALEADAQWNRLILNGVDDWRLFMPDKTLRVPDIQRTFSLVTQILVGDPELSTAISATLETLPGVDLHGVRIWYCTTMLPREVGKCEGCTHRLQFSPLQEDSTFRVRPKD